MSKSTTKASPVETNFAFDCEALVQADAAKGVAVAQSIRLIHSTITPSVSQAAIAKRMGQHDPDRADYWRSTIGHYAQTAALAIGTQTVLTSEHYASDASLYALYRARTTGTAKDRAAMVAAFDGSEDGFPGYVDRWASEVRAAKTAARTASADKSTATNAGGTKNGGADKPADKGEVRPVNLAEIKFGDMLAEVSRRIESESDPKARAAMVKALKVVILKVSTSEPVAA
jgi:hypothetical protein